VLIPLQLVSVALKAGRPRRSIPVLYHRLVCALIGVRIPRMRGADPRASAAGSSQITVSWLDISVVSALAPVVFHRQE